MVGSPSHLMAAGLVGEAENLRPLRARGSVSLSGRKAQGSVFGPQAVRAPGKAWLPDRRVAGLGLTGA